MTSLLVIDIGNTNISLGIFDYPIDSDESMTSSELSNHWRVGTHREQTSDEAVTLLILCN